MYADYEFNALEDSSHHYTKVCLNAERADPQADYILTVTFVEPLSDLNFWMGAQLGAAYVWENWPGHFHGGLNVQIQKIWGYPGSTSPLMVAYATTFALLKALEWQPQQVPTYNIERDEFVFPRSIN